MEKTDAAITINGRSVTSKRARNSASRAALPATNCAMTPAAPSMANGTAEPVEGGAGIRGCIRPGQAERATCGENGRDF